MDFNGFIEKAQNSVRDFLGESVKVQVREVTKNNGITLQGMVITRDGENISPTIYLKPFFEAYEKGKSFGCIIQEIISIYEENKVDADLNFDFFLDYQKVQKRVFQRIVNFEKNRKMLENLPHIRFFDLAVICYYAYMNDFLGKGSILIETGHLDRWGISQETLFEDARNNTVNKLGTEIMGVDELIYEMMSDKLEEKDLEQFSDAIQNAKREVPMYIMTVQGRYFGAVCMYYNEFLQVFAKKCGKNFFILPSSIHELILIPDSGRERPAELKKMVQEVNAGHVAPEEQLSDNVYYFDISQNRITLF